VPPPPLPEPPPGAEPPLPVTERDIERAVFALRRELGLRSLRRRLRCEELDGRSALALAERALELQTGWPAERPRRRRWPFRGARCAGRRAR
jgi:hypothetical protein